MAAAVATMGTGALENPNTFTYFGNRLENKVLGLEARVGIEPTHKGFADLSLTTWVPRHSRYYCVITKRYIAQQTSLQHTEAVSRRAVSR